MHISLSIQLSDQSVEVVEEMVGLQYIMITISKYSEHIYIL